MADENKNNAKLKKETKAFFPYDLPEWDDDTSTEMTTALFRTNLTTLGVQKAHEMLEEKRSSLLSRAKKLEKELKDIESVSLPRINLQLFLERRRSLLCAKEADASTRMIHRSLITTIPVRLVFTEASQT